MKLFKLSLLYSLLVGLYIYCSDNTTGPDKNNCNPLKYVDTTRSYFYYNFDEKIYLNHANDVFFIDYDSLIDVETAEENLSEYNISDYSKLKLFDSNSYLIKSPQGKHAEEFYTFYGYNTDCGFGNQSIVKYSTPVFWINPGIDNSVLILTDEFTVYIDTLKYSLNDLLEINKIYFVELAEIRKYIKDSFILRVTKDSPFNALDMANLYQDSAYAVISAPNFYGLQ